MKAFVIFVALLPLIQSLSLPPNEPLPTDPAKCLQPENVAKSVVSILDMMEVADVQEISIESPATPRKS